MGISLRAYALSPDGAEKFISDSDFREELLWGDNEEDSENPTTLDLEKDWEAVAFVISKVRGGEEFDLMNVGVETTLESTYGFVRRLSIDVVRQVNCALEGVAVSDFSSACTASELRNRDIYPGGDSWDDDSAKYVAQQFKDTRHFFSHAADNGFEVFLGQW